MDKNISGPSNNPSTSSNTPGKTQVIVLRPDFLKKLGISKQLTNLSQLETNDVPNTDISTDKSRNTVIANLDKSSLENEIKKCLSIKRNVNQNKQNTDNITTNLFQNKTNQNVSSKLFSALTTTTTINKDNLIENASISNSNNKFFESNKNSSVIQKNPQLNIKLASTSNLHLNKKTLITKEIDVSSIKQEEINIKDIIKSRIKSKLENKHQDKEIIIIKEKALETKPKETNYLNNVTHSNKQIDKNTNCNIKPTVLDNNEQDKKLSETVFSTRKSGRKRKTSRILEDYITDFDDKVVETNKAINITKKTKEIKPETKCDIKLDEKISTKVPNLKPQVPKEEEKEIQHVKPRKKSIEKQSNISEIDEFTGSAVRQNKNILKTYIRRKSKTNFDDSNNETLIKNVPIIVNTEIIDYKSKLIDTCIKDFKPDENVLKQEQIIDETSSFAIEDTSDNNTKQNTETLKIKQEKSPNKPVINIIENKLVKTPIILPYTETKLISLKENIITDISVIKSTSQNNIAEEISKSKNEDPLSIKVEPEIQNKLEDISSNINKNIEEIPDTENSVKIEDDIVAPENKTDSAENTDKYPININKTESIDPRVAELIAPRKRGRTLGRKNREKLPFQYEVRVKHLIDKTDDTESSIVASKEDETVTEKEKDDIVDDLISPRRSNRMRKENKFENFVSYINKTGPRRSLQSKDVSSEEFKNINKSEIVHRKSLQSDEISIEKIDIKMSDEIISQQLDNTIKEEISNNEELEDTEKQFDESNKQEDSIPSGILMPRKRGRPKKYVIEKNKNTKRKRNLSESDDSSDEIIVKKPKQRRNTSEEVKNVKIIECGVCHEKFANSLWPYHCSKHNYLCWRQGEKEIDLKDRKLCESILMKAVALKKAVFTCEICGEKRKSAVGYLAHIDICNKSEEERLAFRVQCPKCKKFMQPCSMKSHMRQHSNEDKVQVQVQDNETIITEDSNSNELSGRQKRKAAKKAQGLINKVSSEEYEYQYHDKEIKRLYKKGNDSYKKIFSYRTNTTIFEKNFRKNASMNCKIKNCNYVAFDLKEMKSHIENCPKINPNDYLCFVCFFTTESETVVMKHVYETHLIKTKDNDFSVNDDDKVSSASEQFDDDDIDADDDDDDDDDDGSHDDDDDLVEGSDSSKSKKSPKKAPFYNADGKYNANKIKFLAKEMRIFPSFICTYPAAGKWTLEFYQRHYCLNNLFEIFPVLTKNWLPIPLNEQDNYLPQLKKSVSVKTVAVGKTLPNLQGAEHTWKEFNLFETELTNDTITIFCGGPIWALAWLPTPLNLTVDQILAVSLQKTFDKSFKTSQSYSSDEIIQFWNFGPITYYDTLSTVPTLEFCLCHDHGNVWSMEWCPSGCYDEIKSNPDEKYLRRMGLLALACSDGKIPIYSICFPDELPKNFDGIPMYKPKETCILVMEDEHENKLGNWDYQCTKICWSKTKGHSTIVAGYTNGMVCTWELNNKSPLLVSKENDVTIIKPSYAFQPHTAAITALHLYPFDDGRTWLVTGSWDRNSYLWNLKDTSVPVFTYARRGSVSDGAFLIHWLCSIIAFDDVHLLEHTATLVQNPRDYGYKSCSLLAANSMVMGLSTSDWANGIAQVSLAGELTCTFPRQLLISYDVDKGSKCKRLLITYCEAIEKNLEPKKRAEKNVQKNKKSNTVIPEKYDKNFVKYLMSKENEPYEEEPNNFDDAKNHYGLIFCDINMQQYNKIPVQSLEMVKQSLRMRDVPTEMYPFLSQNRVQWNPNKQAYLYVCSGFQAGFVRLRCVRFMHTKISVIK